MSDDEMEVVRTPNSEGFTQPSDHENYNIPPNLKHPMLQIPPCQVLAGNYLLHYRIDSASAEGQALLESIARDWDIREINIGVFGLVGTGKSSFINSVNYVVNGEYVDHMGEGRTDTEYGESITVQRQQLKVTTNISFIDNRGIKEIIPALPAEIIHQCLGHRNMGAEVPESWEHNSWQNFKDILSTMCECQCRRICHKIHCPVIIYSLRDEVEIKTMKTLVQAIYKGTGAYPVIALSFLDKLKDEDMILKLSAQFQSFHCPRVFAFQNYNLSDYKRRPNTQSVILEMVYNCLIVADQVLLRKLGPTGCCC